MSQPHGNTFDAGLGPFRDLAPGRGAEPAEVRWRHEESRLSRAPRLGRRGVTSTRTPRPGRPSVPMVGGRAREVFDRRGRRFEPGAWFPLDSYATNRHRRSRDEPAAFLPERFATWRGDPYDFVSQGGGDHDSAGRCTGEWLRTSEMERGVRLSHVRPAA